MIREGARDWNTGKVSQHGDLDDHHIIPQSWGKDNLKDKLIHTILNRTPLSAETNRNVIGNRLPNEYLPEMIDNNGEGKVKEILKSHLISPFAFEILYAIHLRLMTMNRLFKSANFG